MPTALGKGSHSGIYFIVELRIQFFNVSLFSFNYKEYIENKEGIWEGIGDNFIRE